MAVIIQIKISFSYEHPYQSVAEIPTRKIEQGGANVQFATSLLQYGCKYYRKYLDNGYMKVNGPKSIRRGDEGV